MVNAFVLYGIDFVLGIHHASRNDHAQSFFYRDWQNCDVLFRNQQKEPGGRVGCGRNEDIDEIGVHYFLGSSLFSTSNKGNRIDSFSGIFNEDDFFEGLTLVSHKAIDELFDWPIYSGYNGNFKKDFVEKIFNGATGDFLCNQTEKKHHNKGQQKTQPGNSNIKNGFDEVCGNIIHENKETVDDIKADANRKQGSNPCDENFFHGHLQVTRKVCQTLIYKSTRMARIEVE